MEQEAFLVLLAKAQLRKKIRSRIGFMFLLLVIAAAIDLSGMISGPTTGTVIEGTPRTIENSYLVNMTPTNFTGQHTTFNYPRGLAQVASNPLAGPEIEKASFKARDIQTWFLNVDIYNNEGQPLSSDASYKFRLQNPATYESSHEVINGHTIYIMTNKTVAGFEEVAFFDYNGLRASVALTGDDTAGSAPLQATFNMVLSSWRWL